MAILIVSLPVYAAVYDFDKNLAEKCSSNEENQQPVKTSSKIANQQPTKTYFNNNGDCNYLLFMLLELTKNFIPSVIPIPLVYALSYAIYQDLKKTKQEHDIEILAQEIFDKIERKNYTPLVHGYIDMISTSLHEKIKNTRYDGILAVHDEFPTQEFRKSIPEAQKIIILNTWIPNFLGDTRLVKDLRRALNNGTKIYILMIYPGSNPASLRSDALRELRLPNPDVSDNVRQCIQVLFELIVNTSDSNEEILNNLRIRLYNSLPSISAYCIDSRFFVSIFFHGKLAIQSPQIEVLSANSTLGYYISEEINTLWRIGKEIRLTSDWATALDNLADKFNHSVPTTEDNIL